MVFYPLLWRCSIRSSWRKSKIYQQGGREESLLLSTHWHLSGAVPSTLAGAGAFRWVDAHPHWPSPVVHCPGREVLRTRPVGQEWPTLFYSAFFLIIAIQASVKRYSVVILICFSLMATEVEHLHCLLTICLSSLGASQVAQW